MASYKQSINASEYCLKKAEPNWRIVAERQGEIIVGFRVQKYSPPRRTNAKEMFGSGDDAMQDIWRNRGRRQFTIESARTLRDFLIGQEHVTRPETQYDVIE